MIACLLLSPSHAALESTTYDAAVVSFGAMPVLSFLDGNTDYQQTFNPSWVVASAGTNNKSGLLLRSSNCSAQPGTCTKCNSSPCRMGGPCQDVITFAELLSDDDNVTEIPRFKHVTSANVVLSPVLSNTSMDNRGVQDPRIVFDPQTQMYYMFYTCYNTGGGGWAKWFLCMAVSKDPTSPDMWSVRKGVWPLHFGSKSAALLIRETGPHYMYWGAGVIHIASSSNLTDWPDRKVAFITNTTWGNPHVESGPPPMRLSDGNYVFFHNSWGRAAGYQPGWVVIDGKDPTKIIARAQQPLFSPSKAQWMTGQPPALCNVPNVAFLEAGHPTHSLDEFRVYFGGADSVVGTAVVKFSIQQTEESAVPS